MQPLNQKAHSNVEARYPGMLVVWFGQLMSIGALVCFSLFFVPETSDIPGTSPGSLLRVVLTALGIFFVVISFAVKRKLLKQSVEKQQINLVQKAFVIAVAMCEVSAILGVIERFLINHHDYYFLFVLAAAGTALHFPRREHLVAASYKVFENESTF
jgi:hypothetical protein